MKLIIEKLHVKHADEKFSSHISFSWTCKICKCKQQKFVNTKSAYSELDIFNAAAAVSDLAAMKCGCST